jgi:hypothetical protein
MLVNLTQPITGMNKKPIEDKDGVLTLKHAILLALIQPNPEQRGTQPAEAIKLRRLFDKIDAAEKEVELQAEEIVKLKEIASARLSELISGSICLLIDPEG